ncbi:Predicted PurR-regulated permease PerM [Actinacidiphila yanglinensis]|uniref:Predicted PurR-regulated permease PerM n=1 Tax=Actinacidiphila yanglinensis TaxID=310779 RepID=A0A1H5V0Z7_9ACTN|nr:AI-2E family transporter [Actinacidiphila yanglinensis]SEF80147.1 Predicted PurR-regulated permease PerM [Actinacidiphila yanglinensis]
MPEKRHWSATLASALANLAGRLDERHATVSARDAEFRGAVNDTAPSGMPAAPAPAPAAPGPAVQQQPPAGTETVADPASVPVQAAVSDATAPPVPARTAPVLNPVAVVPWSMRVAAEIGWRLLILAGTVWVLMRVIGAVRLVVLAFVAALLITALLQPFVARLKRMGVPRGLATAMVFIGGFIVMGLVGWFVVWQVMDNIDNLSSSLQDGIDQGKKWLLNSPFHVTDDQINQVANNLSNALGHNTKQITDAGLQGVTVIVEFLTGVLLAMFSTLFLLYDGPNIWNWVLRLFPEDARVGLAEAGPRAWRTLTLYVRGTVIVAMIDAICIGVGIFFLGVPMAVPLAVVIFLSSFVPLVGAVASGAVAVVVALVTEGPFTALLVLGVVLAVQQIEGHILQPFILGRAVRVHPLAVVLSVAAGSLVAGIGGAISAVPLVAVSNTVVGVLRARAKAHTGTAEVVAGGTPQAAVPAAAVQPPAAVVPGPVLDDPGPEADPDTEGDPDTDLSEPHAFADESAK